MLMTIEEIKNMKVKMKEKKREATPSQNWVSCGKFFLLSDMSNLWYVMVFFTTRYG